MRNTTAEIKTTMSKRRNFVNYATFTLSDGTVLHLTPADFRIGGNEFTDDLVYGDSFQVGTAIGKSISIRLDNSDDRFSQYDFYKAYFYLDIHLPDAYEDEHGDLQDGVFQIGKFTVLEPSTTGAVIDISGVDEMYKFDISFDDCTLDFTTQPTLYTLLRRCCTDCGVAIGFSSFSNQNFRVNVKPEGATYREVVSFACQIAGVNAKISNTGALILQWYDMTVFNDDGLDGGTFIHPGQSAYQDGDNADGGSFNPWNTGYVADGGSFLDYLDYHQLYNIKHCIVSTDDIQFTGVRVINDDNAVLVGTSDYVLTLTDNPFTASSPTTVAQFLYNKITQLKFRPFSCSAIQDPTIEAGDAALVYDIKGNVYKTIITNVTFSTGGYMSIACKAQSPTRQQSTYKNPAAEAVVKARREAEKQIDEYAQTVDHFNEIANNALGYYRTDVVESGATITYLHDQPTLQTSQYIIKINSAGIFISEDGGQSYTSGYDITTATMLLNLVYVHGITADWVTSGIFQDKLGNFVLDMDNGTLKLALTSNVGDPTQQGSTTLGGMLAQITANQEGIQTLVAKHTNANYSGAYVPTMLNEPAVNWNTEDYPSHVGDLFIDTTLDSDNVPKGDVYMFKVVMTHHIQGQPDEDIYGWEIQTDITSVYTKTTQTATEVTTQVIQENKLIRSFSGSYIPTTSNEPAVNWNTQDKKAAHEGDLFINTSTGESYRWQNTVGGVFISFDDRCLFETNHDYLQIWYYDSSISKYRHSVNYSGDSLAGKRIFVPTPSFYLYFRTDSTVERWGFKVISCVVGSYDADSYLDLYSIQADSLPSYTTSESISGVSTLPESDHNYSPSTSKLFIWTTRLNPPSNGYNWAIQTNFASMQSQIKQTAEGLELKVSTTDYTGNEIASRINQTATTIRIQASKINLDGYVTFTNLSTSGQTTINAGNITTGTIDASQVTVTNLSASSISGGTLNLGGTTSTTGKNGELHVYNSSGTEIGSWTKNGLIAKQGEFTNTSTSGSLHSWVQISGGSLQGGTVNGSGAVPPSSISPGSNAAVIHFGVNGQMQLIAGSVSVNFTDIRCTYGSSSYKGYTGTKTIGGQTYTFKYGLLLESI